MGSLSTASQIFGDFEVNITTERRPVLYIGSPIGKQEFISDFVTGKVDTGD